MIVMKKKGWIHCIVLVACSDAFQLRRVLPCLNDCSSSLNNYTSSPPTIRGTCGVNGQCFCTVGWGGSDCSKISGNPLVNDFSPSVQRQDKCTQHVCTATCSFGGECTDPLTCVCNDHFGHGPIGDPTTIEDEDQEQTASSSTSRSSSSKIATSMQIDRWSMITSDRTNLQILLKALGFLQPIPKGKADPCVQPWVTAVNHVLVLCNNRGRVTEIDAGRMKLAGTLSEAVTKLSELRVLSLNNNKNLHGPLPNNIGKLTKLEYLLLYKNQFTGPIPTSIVHCRSLITFVAYGNNLSGNLPIALGYLQSSLRMLDVSFNQLSGDIPASIGDLIFLETLYINHNELTGIVPDTIQNLPNLKSFMFQENHITNTVENIGNNNVFSEPDHHALAESYYDEWKNGVEVKKILMYSISNQWKRLVLYGFFHFVISLVHRQTTSNNTDMSHSFLTS